MLLRVLFDEPNRLSEFSRIRKASSSELLRVECIRTIDRLRLQGRITDEEVAEKRAGLQEALERTRLIGLTAAVLRRAGEPFPTAIGTLDALHLASALLWREAEDASFAFLTHDDELGIAARACGLSVLGCDIG